MKNALGMLSHVAVLIALLLVLLGVLTWTGIIRCSVIPTWCDLYEMVVGEPKILIVYGDDGLGDPLKLQQVFEDREVLGKRVDAKHFNFISENNLKEYNLVIVERAKTLSTKKLEDLLSYANAGGKRLIWTADSGTALTAQDIKDDLYLYEDEAFGKGKPHEKIGAWARKNKEGKILNLENFISVHYIGNYCKLTNCITPNSKSGKLVATDSSHPLVFALRSDLDYYGDFTVVEEVKGVGTNIILSLDAGKPIPIKEDETKRIVPLIVTSGTLTENIMYYAFPLEQALENENKYPSLIQNIYKTSFR